MSEHLGLMGGTFNPIHYGHLVTAEQALYLFKLKKIIFIPSGQPPHKKEDLLNAEVRYLMTVMATASHPYFSVSRIELDRPGPSYTIDTVKQLKQVYGEKTELFFITGADAVWEILTWREPEKLAQYCQFIAATRPGYSLAKFEQILKTNPQLPQVHFMEIPALAISGTEIRVRIKNKQPCRYLLPDLVYDYIIKEGFYGLKS